MTQSEEFDLLRRYLRATRHRCEIIDDWLGESLRSFASKAFPSLDLNCTFVPVKSDSRRCEFRSFGDSLFVIVDLELSDRMVQLDHLQVARPGGDWMHTFSTALLCDVFRQHRDLKRYRYCVLKAVKDLETLRGLASLPQDGSRVQAAVVPILLHEVAHVVYRQKEALVEELKQMANMALERFAAGTAEQAATGKPPIASGKIIGVPFDQYDQVRLKSQLEEYTATIRNNEELTEEVTCDLISALAFVNSEARIDCFENLLPERMPISARQLGDAFYIAIKASRYLQFLSGIQQFGLNLASEENALSRSTIEITTRTNALTFLLSTIFKLQIEASEFADKPDFGRPLSGEQIINIMHQSILRLMRLEQTQLHEPFNMLMEFFLNPERFDQEDAELIASYSGAPPDSFEAIDEIRARLPL